MSSSPLPRTRGILELLDRIEAYVLRHEKLPAALYLELRQAVDEQRWALEAEQTLLKISEWCREPRPE